MSISSKLKKFKSISLYKTLKMNIHYFGLRGAKSIKFIVSKNTIIHGLQGTVNANDECKIWLGFGDVGFVDKKNERFIWDVSGEVVFKGDASFSPGCKIVCMGKGYIEFGDNFSCNARTRIICGKRIVFGENCMISWDCTFIDTDFHKMIDSNGEQRNVDKPIVIGDHVWVCSEVLVLKGGQIPNESVICARSTVTKKLDSEHSLYKDDRKIRDNIIWTK